MDEIQRLQMMGPGGAFRRDTSGSPVRSPRPASPAPVPPQAVELIRRLRGALKQALDREARLMQENAALREQVEQAKAAAQAAWRGRGGEAPVAAAPPAADDVVDSRVVEIDGDPWGGDENDDLS